jgi:hypothetical protein
VNEFQTENLLQSLIKWLNKTEISIESDFQVYHIFHPKCFIKFIEEILAHLTTPYLIN